jgi:glycosyltransferase involved in cell wall biosynthesis
MAGAFPRVSILIPAYNLRFFKDALSSALDQDYGNLEIIVCDNSRGSEIAQICESLDDGRVAYVKNPRNLGFSGNFAECFKRAAGEYVKFLTDDDVLLPSCVSRMVEEFQKHGSKLALVTSRRRVINERNEMCADVKATMPLTCVTSYMEGQDLGNFALVNSTNFIGEPSTVMFRKHDVDLRDEHLFMLNGIEYTCLADLSLWLRLLSKGGAVYLAEPMSLFRVHAGQEQAKPDVQIKCVTERFFLVLGAKALGFLKSPELYDQAMREVGKIFNAALSNPDWDAESRKKLEAVRREIPTEYLRS